jgi:hypothetical protein
LGGTWRKYHHVDNDKSNATSGARIMQLREVGIPSIASPYLEASQIDLNRALHNISCASKNMLEKGVNSHVNMKSQNLT